MGKRLICQRRGKGSPTYRAPSHRFVFDAKYPPPVGVYAERMGGQVVEITRDQAHSAPIAKVLLENFEEVDLLAAEGMKVGDWIWIGSGAKLERGCVTEVGRMDEGTFIYNLELERGDGGKLIRSAGSYGQIVSHEREMGLTYVKLPSKRIIAVRSNVRATIGRVAGGGRKEKPFVKAGQVYHAAKARNRLYPRVRGKAMNPVDHPHGGGSHQHTGRPTVVKKTTPPGRKVGHIAARRTGRRKR